MNQPSFSPSAGPMLRPFFEYRTTFALIPDEFPLNHELLPKQLGLISPKVPKGEDWRLASSTTVTRENGDQLVLYFWEREARVNLDYRNGDAGVSRG